MKVVMTLLVRDEADILREHLEFHLARGVDEVILMDNRSTDATADIARSFERAGRLHYIFQPDDDYAQGRWVTQMARRACTEFGADWVINSDADEFWWPHVGSIKDVLAEIPAGIDAVAVERTNFVPRPENGESFWRRMDVRHTSSVNALGQRLPSKTAHRAYSDIVVSQGNHDVGRAGRPLGCAPAEMTILHFPLRSRAQFVNKIANGGAAYERNAELDPGVGATWRELYRAYLAGTLNGEYDKEVLSDDAIAAGLAAGTLQRDKRLIDALSALLPAKNAAIG